MKDQISKNFDIAPINNYAIVPNEPTPQVEDDFEYARGNIIAAIDKGQEALTSILDVAEMSQNPRAFEVVAIMLKTVAEANKDLLELQKRKKDLTGISPNPTTVNNNLFVGSTAELQKLIKKQRDEQS